MLKEKHATFGKLKTIIMDFPITGDVLPMHTHNEVTVHITIVARGSFKAHGNGWEREVKAGDVLDFRSNDPHEFIALEDNSRIVNIIKG